MRRVLSIALSVSLTSALALTAIFTFEKAAQAQNNPQAIGAVHPEMIVSTEWLAKHLNDKSLVLLQVGEKTEYTEAHIPGAQFISVADITTPRGEGLSNELLPVDQLKRVFEKLGISDKSRIVIYFSKDWVSPTARVYFTLDYLGLGDRASILDGGLPAWRAAGQPVTSVLITPMPGKISPKPRPELVVNADWVKSNLVQTGVKLLDARAPQFYTGAEVGRMPRGGHIPGASNIPFSSVVNEADNRFKSAGALRELFRTAGVEPGGTVATYCHTGQQATVLYFAARYLGINAHLYDGSFEDWSKKTELPVEKVEGPKP